MEAEIMSESIDIQETKTVYVAWTNTDCTEGRGQRIPKAVCDLEATARRLGKKGSVRGSDCQVSQSVAVRLKNQWYIPGRVTPPTKDDMKAGELINMKYAAIKKAKDAGLNEEDLKLLRR